jgi:hypothetical protein
MFEAVSLQKDPPEPHGRFTKPLQPQGFEALAGVTIKPSAQQTTAKPSRTDSHAAIARAPTPHGPSTAAQEKETRRREQEEATARRKQEAVKKAEAAVDRAKTAEANARAEWNRAKQELEEAERGLRDAVRG